MHGAFLVNNWRIANFMNSDLFLSSGIFVAADKRRYP